jgi:hypothetical protein
MKIVFLMTMILVLAACQEKCEEIPNQEKWDQCFFKCLETTSDARKSKAYTTNERERFHLIVPTCSNVCRDMNLKKVCDTP